MHVLIAYDVSTSTPAGIRRLRRVAQACQDYGLRVQKSIFECRIGPTQWVALRARLLGEVDEKQDSLRFYFLDEDVLIEHHGTREPLDLEGSLVV